MKFPKYKHMSADRAFLDEIFGTYRNWVPKKLHNILAPYMRNYIIRKVFLREASELEIKRIIKNFYS